MFYAVIKFEGRVERNGSFVFRFNFGPEFHVVPEFHLSTKKQKMQRNIAL